MTNKELIAEIRKVYNELTDKQKNLIMIQVYTFSLEDLLDYLKGLKK